MQLHNLEIEKLVIPFRIAFQHSAATRASTETIIVKATTISGLCGIGEGCPRSYVTGETVDTTIDFFNAHQHEFMELGSIEDLKTWTSNNRALIDSNPAAFCSIELALINALALENNQSIEEVLSLPKLTGAFQYTGVLGSRNPHIFDNQLSAYLKKRINDFKVKLFGKDRIDRLNLEAFEAYKTNESRLRFDANNLWTKPDEALSYIKKHGLGEFSIEEPLSARNYLSLLAVFNQTGSRIILDESFTRVNDFKHIYNTPESWIVNIRVSKLGGLLRSIEAIEKSKQLGIPVIIGAQVGETSILTRAAQAIANACREVLVAQEGAFGTHLLKYDIVEPPIMFGGGGTIRAEQIPKNITVGARWC
ncbi:MAG: enolase C-terminal domain-like protein [Arenicellales bacterium]